MRTVLLTAAGTLCLVFAAHAADAPRSGRQAAMPPPAPTCRRRCTPAPGQADGCIESGALLRHAAYTTDDDAECCAGSQYCSQYLSTQRPGAGAVPRAYLKAAAAALNGHGGQVQLMAIMSAETILDFAALARAPVSTDPFPHRRWYRISSRRPVLQNIHAGLPRMERGGSFPHRSFAHGPGGRGPLMTEMEGPGFGATPSLASWAWHWDDAPTMLTVRLYCREKDGQIHTRLRRQAGDRAALV